MGYFIDGDLISFKERLNKIDILKKNLESSYCCQVERVITVLNDYLFQITEEIRAINTFENSFRNKNEIVIMGNKGVFIKEKLLLLYDLLKKFISSLNNMKNVSVEELKSCVSTRFSDLMRIVCDIRNSL